MEMNLFLLILAIPFGITNWVLRDVLVNSREEELSKHEVALRKIKLRCEGNPTLEELDSKEYNRFSLKLFLIDLPIMRKMHNFFVIWAIASIIFSIGILFYIQIIEKSNGSKTLSPSFIQVIVFSILIVIVAQLFLGTVYYCIKYNKYKGKISMQLQTM